MMNLFYKKNQFSHKQTKERKGKPYNHDALWDYKFNTQLLWTCELEDRHSSKQKLKLKKRESKEQRRKKTKGKRTGAMGIHNWWG